VLSPGEDDVTELHRSVLEPWAGVTTGRSLNFSLAPLSPAEVREAFEPADYERLSELRKQYDPHQRLAPNHQI
jgi:hypothetical protein